MEMISWFSAEFTQNVHIPHHLCDLAQLIFIFEYVQASIIALGFIHVHRLVRHPKDYREEQT